MSKCIKCLTLREWHIDLSKYCLKTIKHHLNLQHYFVYFESWIQSQITIKYKIDMSFPQKYY